MSAATSVDGIVSYLDDGVASSLVRNGAVWTRRDGDGSDGATEGMDLVDHRVAIHDVRRHEVAPTLHREGFEVRTAAVRTWPDFYDHRAVLQDYYPDCEALVARATGAPRVFAFDHNVRSASGQRAARRIREGQQVQGPAHMVHGDYTLTSAPLRLQQLTEPPRGNDTLREVLGPHGQLVDPSLAEAALAPGGRFALVNVWRNIADVPVATHPLALCDARTVRPDDLVVFEIHYADRIGENYFAKASPRHRWWYWSGLTRDEALLIKQWDSSGALARSHGARSDDADPEAPSSFSFHTAFDDPSSPPDAPDRTSIEVRCVALWPAT